MYGFKYKKKKTLLMTDIKRVFFFYKNNYETFRRIKQLFGCLKSGIGRSKGGGMQLKIKFRSLLGISSLIEYRNKKRIHFS